LLNNPANYILAHWKGQQGLAWSFWVNFVALRVAITLVQIALEPAKTADYSAIAPLVWLLMLIFHGIVFIWQAVGVLRSAESHLRDTGSQASVWGAQIALVAGFWLTASYGLQAWHTTLPLPQDNDFLARMDREHASKYELELSQDGSILRITGSIELGITRNTEALVKENPDLELVILESDGGNIFEGRGLARIFRENALNTHVTTICASACTLAFIGGKKRSMAPGAKIGFHQYRVDADYSVIAANPAEEQQRDRKLFADNRVSAAFLDRIFQSRANEMWFPTPQEMLGAGVIDEITITPGGSGQ
jgi:ATP-dependent protease ClpP protease subunit